jgi:hypothetical protein
MDFISALLDQDSEIRDRRLPLIWLFAALLHSSYPSRS